MTRFAAIDLSNYPIEDVIEALDYESYLARDKADLQVRWDARRATRPDLPPVDFLNLETEPLTIGLQVGSFREMLLRSRVNDRARSLTLAGALGRALDHIGVTYYRTPRRVIVPADPAAGIAEILEDDETYRQRLALAPESWSTAGPVGGYLFFGLSSSGDVLDLAAYSEDEGVCLAPRIRVAVLSRVAGGVPSADLLATVRQALRREDLRPMGDLVTTETATPLPFDVAYTLRLRNGASPALVTEASRKRVLDYCSGRLRWIGDGETGPVWLVGRRIRQDTIAAAAHGSDPNILEVDVQSPAADVNAPHPGYTDAALAGVGSAGFVPLADAVTAHLFRAPRLGTITVNHELMPGGWS